MNAQLTGPGDPGRSVDIETIQMAFHVPPTTTWKPEVVRDSLLAMGLPVRIDSGTLFIDVPAKHRPNRFLLFLRGFELFRRVFGSGYPPYHEFRFHENRFVNNLEIHWNVDALAENDDLMSSIRDVMTRHGCPEVGMNPTEREVIQQYRDISTDLDATLNEIETLRMDREARQDSVQFWARWRQLNMTMERLCTLTCSG